MGVSVGYKQSVYWGDESTYASKATINKDLGAVQSISPSEKNNLFKLRTLGGNRDYKSIVPGKFEISGTMDYHLQGGAFLRQAFGEDTATTATVDSGPKILVAGSSYLHIMGSATSPEVNSFPSFSLEFTDYEDSGAVSTTNNLKRTYVGCRVNSLSINAAVDEPVKCSVDWMAKRVIVGTGAPSTITAYTQDPFVFYQGHVYLSTGVATAGTPQANLHSDVICQVNSIDFTVNNNVEAGWYIAGTCNAQDVGLREAKYIIPKGRDYDLKLGLHYNTRELYQRFLGAVTATTDQNTIAKTQIIVDFVRAGTIGTKANGTDYMRLYFSSCIFEDIAINGAPEDIVNNDVTVFAKNVKCYFVDDQDSYE